MSVVIMCCKFLQKQVILYRS